MKVYINKYRNHWVSPYTIAEKLCFWREIDYREPWVQRLNKILEPVCTTLYNVLDKIHPKIDYVKIDKWDTWNMDSTLAFIIHPMLVQLKATKHGHPSGLTEKKWNKILDEMIWAFEQITLDGNDEQFWIEHGEIDWDAGEYDERGLKPVLWKKKAKVDWKGLKKHHTRIDKGLELFGIHYRHLWD